MFEFLDSFFFTNLLYCLLIIIISIGIINNSNTNKIDIKDRFTLKNIDIKFLFKIIFLAFFARIVIEQLLIFLNFSITQTIEINSVFEIIFQIIIACIIAPIFEEIVFRFGLFEFINKKYNFIISIILTSIIFAFVHFYGIIGFIIPFMSSIFFTYSYYKKQNLLYPIIIHFMYNLYAISYGFVPSNIIFIIIAVINLLGFLIITINEKRK